MLVSLSIRDIVLIDRLDLDWQGGLCTLTGETGAGKSILLDALGLATGARGDAGLVRHNIAQGSVTAIFEIPPEHEIRAILAAHDIGVVGELVLRRVQTEDGRTRAYCNDSLISVGLLKEIGARLVEIHGQNESRSLTDAAAQRDMLDAYAGLSAEVVALREIYEQHRELAERVEALENAATQAAQEADFLRHSVEELEAIQPEAGEETRLAEERAMLLGAEKISTDLSAAAALLQGDEGMDNALNMTLKNLERVAPEAGGRLDAAIHAIERALVEAAEARREIDEAARTIVFDAARLEIVEDRLFGLRDIARKHRVEVDRLPNLLEDLRARLNEVDGGAGQLDALREQRDALRGEYEKAAESISLRRHAAAKELDEAVTAELPALKLDGGAFMTCITTDATNAGAYGIDRISFEASTNPGMPRGAIAKIASGGELARFMLALKVALSVKTGAGGGQAETSGQVLIFDEVDAGVGGAVAEAVGSRLKALAETGQVLVVTHSPQVAARGDHQWRVRKNQNGATTLTEVTPLNAEARLEEIARMLSGAEITDEARGAAAQLLRQETQNA